MGDIVQFDLIKKEIERLCHKMQGDRVIFALEKGGEIHTYHFTPDYSHTTIQEACYLAGHLIYNMVKTADEYTETEL